MVLASCRLTEAAENGVVDKSYNHLFDVRNIEGWTVYVNKDDLADHAQEMNAALKHLQQQLYQVRLNVPAPAVAIMQQRVPVWFEYDTIGIAYHHRGWLIANDFRPPDVENLVGFCRAKTFLNGALHQPSVVFHELAHGYDYLYLRHLSQDRRSLLAPEYEKAMKAGKYANVLCRYSSGAKAYGANNPGEFFSENSEAFFGVNDFYPFVRAELAEYDPDTYQTLTSVWGVDVVDLQRRQRCLVALMDGYASPAGWAEKPQTRPESVHDGSCVPTPDYTKRSIEGWTVYVSPDLQEKVAHADEACKLLGHKLHLVRRYVPDKGLSSLQKMPIWLEENDPTVPYIVYHDDKRTLRENGLNPDKHGAIEVGNTDNFQQWQNLQPSAVLHHLACAYFDRMDKADRTAVAEMFGKAAKSGKYDRVLRFDGKRVRHPALLNPREYFAELSESYYGFNDHYPFLQFELSRHDPDACVLLARLWGGKAK